jgi:Zn finger protein HypA/HybF involved in hydrogenase expression
MGHYTEQYEDEEKELRKKFKNYISCAACKKDNHFKKWKKINEFYICPDCGTSKYLLIKRGYFNGTKTR